MSIQTELIEHLLLEDEGAALDFKREQYPFVGAGKAEKSELLKDVLAFANAFRRIDAYILVGVDERRGRRSEVVGVSVHLDDASLQQFVNSRTQRPVTFSYHEAVHDDRPIGVLHIPLQERPIYANSHYGKVRRGEVYLRRGSSTAIATPDEIVLMGRSSAIAAAAQPSAEMHVVDRTTGRRLSQPVHAEERTWYEVPSGEALPDYHGFAIPNRDYYREIAACIEARDCLRVALEIENSGGIVIHDATLRLEVHDPDRRYELRGPKDVPSWPGRSNMHLVMSRVSIPDVMYDVNVVREGDFWKVECEFGKVQPRSKARLANDLLVGARLPGELDVRGHVYGDNIRTPIAAGFRLSFSRGSRAIAARDIVRVADERD